MIQKLKTDGTNTIKTFEFQQGDRTCVDTLGRIVNESQLFMESPSPLDDDEMRICKVKKLKITIEVEEL